MMYAGDGKSTLGKTGSSGAGSPRRGSVVLEGAGLATTSGAAEGGVACASAG